MYIYTPLGRYWITLYRYVLGFIVPHVYIQLEDNKQYLSDTPRSLTVPRVMRFNVSLFIYSSILFFFYLFYFFLYTFFQENSADIFRILRLSLDLLTKYEHYNWSNTTSKYVILSNFIFCKYIIY